MKEQYFVFDFCTVDLVRLLVFHECFAFVDHFFYILTVIEDVLLERLG